ncbi:aldo/keto reductase, partial [candidate division KSB1 bacterium]
SVSNVQASIGGADDRSPVIDYALNRGVNFFDTSPGYWKGNHATMLGKIMKSRGKEMVVTTKLGIRDKKADAQSYVERFNKHLAEQLQSDYVDFLYIHSPATVEDLKNEAFHAAFRQLKAEGKVRFLGISCHGPDPITICRALIDDGRFDCVLLSYNFSADIIHYRKYTGWPELKGVVKEIAAKNIGLVAMKIQAGAWGEKLIEKQDYSKESIQTSMRWVYQDTSVTCPIVSVGTFESIDNMVEIALNPRMTDADHDRIERYMASIHGRRCPIPCPAPCREACPHNVPVNDAQRSRMYYESYGRVDDARESYAGLVDPEAPVPCDSCTDRPCGDVCPNGINIARLMNHTHRILTA